jgi:hypothetical protein
MVTFWDTSALVALVAQQPIASALRTVPASSRLAVWWGTLLECESAFARLERDIQTTSMEVDEMRQVLASLATQWHEIQPSTEVRQRAMELVHRWPLRAADALQLAAALQVSDGSATDVCFVTLDRRLSEAARGEQLMVRP